MSRFTGLEYADGILAGWRDLWGKQADQILGVGNAAFKTGFNCRAMHQFDRVVPQLGEIGCRTRSSIHTRHDYQLGARGRI